MRILLLAGLTAWALTVPGFAQDAPQPSPPDGPCRLHVLAKLDMEMVPSGRITVPVSINGVEKRMLVDTGAAATLLAATAAAELKLAPRVVADAIQGFGGELSHKVVYLDEFGIGKMRGKDFSLFVAQKDFESAGLLGADFLVAYDLDFDFANATLRFIAPNQCPGKAVYWSKQPFGVVPFEIDDNHIKVKVVLDGKEASAMLDTGAADTIMSLDRATKTFSLDEKELRRSRHYPFKTLTFGDVNIGNPAIYLVPDDESKFLSGHDDDTHMIIGMSVLRRLHLYVAYKEKKIYVTPATQY